MPPNTSVSAAAFPLSNTNQIWGLAWGTAGIRRGDQHGNTTQRLLLGVGSLVMMAGAWAISFPEATGIERAAWRKAAEQESARYRLDIDRTTASLAGEDPLHNETPKRRWWEPVIALAATGVFVYLAGDGAPPPAIGVNPYWMGLLCAATLALLGVGGALLWRRTRFS